MYPGTFAAATPDKPAVVLADTGATLTYAELEERSIRLADVLRIAGLQRGDHIAFVSPNALEVFEIYWAALRSGLYVTGVNYNLTPDEATYVVGDCGAMALIASAECLELALAIAADVPAWPHPKRRPTSHVGRTCSTPRAQPGSPRECCRRCPTGR